MHYRGNVLDQDLHTVFFLKMAAMQLRKCQRSVSGSGRPWITEAR
jgi:hypothetical protein